MQRIKSKIKTILIYISNIIYRFLNKKKFNPEAKKLVYIGHSYHSKTKSTRFLIDYLAENFEVTEVLDESWDNKPYPDLSFIDESYCGVIFFQSVPPVDVVAKIKNTNLMFIPMFDGYGHAGYDFWWQFRSFKILNFSKTLNEKLLKWGMESMAVQYFPDPMEFKPGNPNEIFFWQRITPLNIKVVEKLFENEKDLKIHIHKVVDPNQEFTQPTPEEEKQFSITYSVWFDTREQMQEVVHSKGIYIAPREFEGIGQSFLEAMAMGKAVVAVNNPTMNEYIRNNETGYLYNLHDPHPIDISNIQEIQKNTWEYMQQGYKEWKLTMPKIIDFIKKF